MRVRGRGEHGDTLLEIIVAIVIIGLVVGAFFATYATQGSGSTAHRSLVTADGLLRSAAETTKSAVRAQCINGAPEFTVDFSELEDSVDEHGEYAVEINDRTCPPRASADPWAPLDIKVTMPSGKSRILRLVVRSP